MSLCMQHLMIRRGKAKQGGLLGGDDDSLTQCFQNLGRCLVLDHQLARGALCTNGQKAMIASWQGAERIRQSLEGRRFQLLREYMLRRVVQGSGAGGTEFAYSILLPELSMRSGWALGN